MTRMIVNRKCRITVGLKGSLKFGGFLIMFQ